MKKLKQKETIKDILLFKNPVLKPILLLSIPIILNSIFLILHDMIDIGYLSYMPLSNRQDNYNNMVEGIGVSSIYFSLFISVSIALSISISSILYKKYLSKEEKSYKSIASKLILLLFISGIILSILALLFSAVYLNLFNYNTEKYNIINNYNKIKSTSLIFVFIYLGYQTIKQSQNSFSKSIILNIICLILHIIFNYILVYYFNLQLSGLAYGFLISFALSTFFIVFDLLLDKKKNIRIETTFIFKQDINIKGLIKQIALPFILNIANTIALLLIIYISTTLGEIFSAGFIITLKFISLFNVIVLSITSSLSSFITNNFTYKNYKRILDAYNNIRFFLIMLNIIFVFTLIFLGDILLKYYMNINQNTTVDIIKSFEFSKFYLFWFILLSPFTVLLYVDLAYLSGINKQNISLIIQFIRIWVIRIPLLLILNYLLVYSKIRIENSIWISFLLSNLITYFITLHFKFKYLLKGDVKNEGKI